MTINEKTEDEYETQFDELNNIFPNANFTISMDIEELDEVVTDKKFIVVKQNYNCYCYDNCDKQPRYFYVTDNIITNKVILNKLI
jgi:hypothetical protein